MRAFALVLGVAACSFRPGEPPVADDAREGDGEAVVVDSDLDGLAEADDNCPTVANLSQANEDNDDRGDACDGCPHMSGLLSGTDGDSDGDNIGDQCDPRVGPDRLVVFVGFNDSAEGMLFQQRSGGSPWSISGGAVHMAADVATAQQIVWTGESITGDVVAHTTAHIETLSTGSGTRLAAVVAGWHDATPITAYAGGLRVVDPSTVATAAVWHFVSPPTLTQNNTPMPNTFTAGLVGFIRLRVIDQSPNSTQDCRVDATSVSQAVAGDVPIGYPGFRVLGVTASFDYLFVVELGP